MSLERIVSLALALVVAVTIISLIFYEMSHSADTGSSKLKSSHSIASASTDRQMKLLNESLTILRNELQNMRSDNLGDIAVKDIVVKDVAAKEIDVKDVVVKDVVVKDVVVKDVVVKDIVAKDIPPAPALRASAKKTALLFTMDSISSYESASKKGGAAGELLIRHSLEKIFKELNVQLDVKTNDIGAVDSTDCAHFAAYNLLFTAAISLSYPYTHYILLILHIRFRECERCLL